MLTNFFQLNNFATATVIANATAFAAMFSNSNELMNAVAAGIQFPRRTKIFRGKRFTNVNFSKSTFDQITLTDCTFVDCLFIGAEFSEVEFHGCRFQNSNFYKADFWKVYIDCRLITFDKHLRRTHSNVMLGLYQKLFDNYEDSHQWKFPMYADIERRRWDRFQTSYRVRRWRLLGGRELLGSIWDLSVLVGGFLANLSYGTLIRYGYGPGRLLAFSLAGVLALAWYVDGNWSELGLLPAGQTGSYSQALFYVATVVSTLGYSRYVPSTDWGYVFSSGLGLLGLAWSGLFIAVLIRRFVR